MQNIKEKLLSNQIEKKLGKLSLHKKWTRRFVLRVFVCFSAHIVLACRALQVVGDERNVDKLNCL